YGATVPIAAGPGLGIYGAPDGRSERINAIPAAPARWGKAREGGFKMKLPRRQFLHLAAAAAALPAVSRSEQAQSYPSRPVTLVVPIAAGGGLDTSARMLAEKLQDKLRQPFVVENRSGAGSTVGTNFVAKAKPRWVHSPAHGGLRRLGGVAN